VPNRDGVAAQIRIGTSGWEYDHWRGSFYPSDLRRDRWLEHYAERFDTVELNASFYRLPLRATFDRWATRVPDGFVYAVKASRYLTHVKRLKEPMEPLARLWGRADGLGPHLGPVLYQLPPRWKPDLERLAGFLAALPGGRAQAIEIRDPRWYGEETVAAIAAADVAVCLHDMPGSARAGPPTGPFAYVRFHGAGQRYGGRYPDAVLERWAASMVEWADGGMPVWAYFNNDIGGHAVVDAERLRAEVERRR
jgi:uncharacterized protein YecE (DUF72 family)